MAKFRKKPVIIEAIQLPDASLEGGDRERGVWDVMNFFGSDADAWRDDGTGNGGVFVETLEGTMHGQPGDWIIRGTKGELYPCKPDIFADIYEPVEA